MYSFNINSVPKSPKNCISNYILIIKKVHYISSNIENPLKNIAIQEIQTHTYVNISWKPIYFNYMLLEPYK
ncbi:Hypothetical protein ERWE_CDS_08230 [Ehrlichia ruminantium str. Welgevonden]|uniref:Uncharacterized protein n=1 Tax=Ehrlichia ruminantium (strain Welgevonden) TaxID=254945 RepID=A0A0H3M6R9_EHRRW|nr:Hypothetical protein ERWE_CDS_08230 [Ehrlichia ruminantium str. Welgevonden]